MRVLTVRHPWAAAIIYEATDPRDGSKHRKDVENRTRNIAGDYRGPVAIHAALAWDVAAFRTPGTSPLGRWWDWETIPAMELTRGHIIGVVDLVDVHSASVIGGCGRLRHDCPEHGTCREHCSPWAEGPSHAGWMQHLVLENPRALDEPIPYRGALGLRTLDEATAAAVLAAIA